MDLLGQSSSDSDSEDEFFNLMDAACYIPAEPKKRIMHERIDFYEKYDEVEFESRFRITKDMARQLVQLLRPSLTHDSERNMPVSVDAQVLVTMRYFATSSFEAVVADLEGIHQTTAGRIVKKVSHALAAHAHHFIKMPSEAEWIELNNKFYQIGRIPRVIGVIDGCHVPIISPGGDKAETFRNRKGWFSINVMALCDADMRIRNIVARWPGSTHDQTVFSLSQLRANFEAGSYRNNIILGDSGYRCTPYLITPLLNPISHAEKKFQKGFIKTRNIIERVFGAWKRRFPIIGMKMRMFIDDALAVIVATAVLHNVCIGSPLPPPILYEELLQPDEIYHGSQPNIQTGTRRAIIEHFFN